MHKMSFREIYDVNNILIMFNDFISPILYVK